ncbi:glycosyltransferase [Candidatus Omnitrophota bacterium]
MKKNVLLLHISNISGHRSASMAIEAALAQLDQSLNIRSIDSFNYTSPLAEKVVNAFYMFVVKTIPGLWDYLYDNQDVLERSRQFRSLVHRLKDRKIKKLLDQFRPDVIVCTQAFPCGMIADYKRKFKLPLPLVGILTDYAPHGYWVNELVDIYVVPAEKVKERLILKGIPEQRIKVFGIPIDTKFAACGFDQDIYRKLRLNPKLPTILVMGGGQGLGPIKEIVRALDSLRLAVQIIVVCGTNKRLYRWLNSKSATFGKTVRVIGYTNQIKGLMGISSFIVTKPGGLTSAEALSQSLPIVIVNPLPGQESQNTNFLLDSGAALKADSFVELHLLAERLLSRPEQLIKLRQKAQVLSYPDSATKASELVLQMLNNKHNSNHVPTL